MRTRKQSFKPRRGLRLALRRSAPLWWGVTLALGLLTTLVVASSISAATRAAAAWGREREAWVVQRRVEAGEVIGVTAVRRVLLPRGVIPEGALAGASSPVGEATRVSLARGEVVLTARLAGRGAHGVAAMVPPGYRAVSVPYDDQMPQVRAGDRVDVLATFDVGDGDAEEAAETAPSFAVAVDAEVLVRTPRAVTLAVEIADAPRVAFALAKAALTIALRPPQERTVRR